MYVILYIPLMKLVNHSIDYMINLIVVIVYIYQMHNLESMIIDYEIDLVQ